MNIAVFSDTFPPLINGVANMAFRSAEALAERGHRVCVFTVSKEDGRGAPPPSDKFSIVYIPSITPGIYREYRLALPSAKWFADLKEFDPDIIHSHTPFGVGWAAVIGAKMLGVPLVATHHTFLDYYLKYVKLDYDWMKRLSWRYTVAYYNRCDLVVSPSRSLAEAMTARKLKRRIAIVENFIDTDFFRPAKTVAERSAAKKKLGISGPSLTYMGRLSPEKNIDDVIRSFAEARKSEKDMTLVLIGDGPSEKKLTDLAEELALGKSVVFTGFMEGVALAEALRANEAFITASRSENMPLSVLEGMASGLPVITVKEKGMPEIVEDGVNGLFAKTGDHSDMAGKIVAVMSDSALRTKLAKGSRTLALHFSKNSVMEKMENLYKELIAQKSNGRHQ